MTGHFASKATVMIRRLLSVLRAGPIVWVLVTQLLAVSLASGQNPQLQTRNGKRFPTVVFSLVYWQSDPSYYSIAIDSTGTSTYQSAPNSLEHTGVPYTVEFQSSDRTRRTIFNIAQRLGFFADTVQAVTLSPETAAVRTLAYHNIQLANEITYSSSPNPDMQEITSIFEEVSETLEHGRRLGFLLQAHSKTALDAELKSMQTELERHHLRELQAVTAVLSSVAADPKLDGDIHDRAEALLREARGPRATWP